MTIPVLFASRRGAARWNFWRLAVLVLIGLGSAQAQNRARPAPVTGTVLDPSGASVASATVNLKGKSDKTLSSTRTDVLGRFRFGAVSEGAYSVEVQKDSFDLSVTPFEVGAQPPAPLTITLVLASLVSEVTVTGNDPAQVSTDIAENRDAAAVDQSLLENVPVFDQDYLTTMSAFLDAASIGTSGPQLIVNGMAVTSAPITASAIQEVRINQNPYSAELSRPGRGSLEIITKDPTTSYHGTFNAIFRDATLNARDAFALVRAPEQRRIFEGALTGPLGHSKSTSFVLSGHRQEEDLDSIVFAENLAGPVQESVPSPKRDTQLSVHIDHQFSDKHGAFWQYNEWDYPSSNQGVGGFVLPEAGTNLKQWEREVVFNDHFAPTPHWLLQFQLMVGFENHATTSVNSAQKIVVQDAFTTGGAQTDLLNTEKHFTLNEIASWNKGKHAVKFGLNIPDWSYRGIVNHSGLAGTFFFSSLADYAAGTPYAFREQQGLGTVHYLQQELGAFVQDEYRLRPNFSLSFGLRYNWQNYLHDDKQFAPRLAFAYSPDKKRKTVIRGGAGIFYDRTGAGPLGDVELYNGQRLLSFLITNPTYPDPFAGGAKPATDVVQFAPDIREPYSVQYSLSVERQLAKRTTVAITYNGSLGVALFRSRDINAPLPPVYLNVPNPALGVLRQMESTGRQAANSLDVTFRGDQTRYLTGLVQYTLSRTDNNTGGVNWLPANQYDLSGEWARADFDQRHRLNLLESLRPGKQFTLGVGASAASGKPYSLTIGQDVFHTGLTNARPNGVPRNSLEGPSYMDLDLRISRDFYLSKNKKDKEKGMVTTVGIEGFNMLNHVNYVSYVGNLRSPLFGQAVAALPTRRLQLTARFKF